MGRIHNIVIVAHLRIIPCHAFRTRTFLVPEIDGEILQLCSNVD